MRDRENNDLPIASGVDDAVGTAEAGRTLALQRAGKLPAQVRFVVEASDDLPGSRRQRSWQGIEVLLGAARQPGHVESVEFGQVASRDIAFGLSDSVHGRLVSEDVQRFEQ